MGADCTYAYANPPSPTQLTYVRIDDAYADWYRARLGKEVDHSLVQGHPEAGALWGNTSTRSSTASISFDHTRTGLLQSLKARLQLLKATPERNSSFLLQLSSRTQEEQMQTTLFIKKKEFRGLQI